MNTFLKLTAIFLLAALQLSAQQPDLVIARAYYSFEHVLDTNQQAQRYREDMLLALGKQASVFTSLSKIYQERSLVKQAEEQTKNYTGDAFPVIRYAAGRYTTPTEIYRFNQDKKLFVKENLVRNFLYEEDYPAINWQVTTDTASILGIACQQAKARFKGRNWLVWFAPGLPFSAGPWLLGGLPGLIVKAHDDRNEVRYQLTGFEKAAAGKPFSQKDEFKSVDFTQAGTIELPKERISTNNKIKVVRTTKKEMTKLQEAMNSNPAIFRKAQLEATNGVVYDEEAYQSLKLKPKSNNPIAKATL